MDKNYFIKEGYEINDVAKTFETEYIGEYWTKIRLKKVTYFQYDVYKLAESIIRKKKFKTGIDLGCGPAGKAKKFLRPWLNKLILIDQPNCEKVVKKILPENDFFGVDLESFKLDLGIKADIIICSDVVEHLADPLPTIEFCKNSIKADGIIIFSTPERDILRGVNSMKSPHSAHVREWNTSEFKQFIESLDLRIIKHILLPPKKLNSFTNFHRLLFGSIMLRKEWHSCQVVICTV